MKPTAQVDADILFARLSSLAGDLWWSWQPGGAAFWASLDGEAWTATGHNPVALLADAGPQAIAARFASDSTLEGQLAALEADREAYQGDRDTWHDRAGQPIRGLVAYFSAEYGIHESLPNYSGGLGILSGDHVKSASDIGLPFVAVGLLYRNGYVRQQIDAEGRQVPRYEDYDFERLVCRPVTGPGGLPTRVEVPILGETCHVQIWRVRVGRVDLYLLDTDQADNPDHLRGITAQLYGGGHETRIKQELVLGVGGVRAIRALGLEPTVWHLNEGHSSFLNLERIRERVEGGAGGVPEAIEAIRDNSVFTTHTPVEAGHDRFAPLLAWQHLKWFADAVGLDADGTLALGRWPTEPGGQSPFNMTLLAMRTCTHLNGVAALHGEVSRQMFGRFWPGLPEGEVPITSVTNGVHAPSWQGHGLTAILDEHLPPGWRDEPSTHPVWQAVDAVPDDAIWSAHHAAKQALFEVARQREAARRSRLGLDPWTTDRLDPKVLTIGFARRFAPYKRADLIFSDMQRLLGILDRAPGPVQILYAGKAHPADTLGQQLVQNVYRASHDPTLEGRVLLIEDYDIELGRALVQGVDVWLNNPRRPKEASGTSGMKVSMNGGLNLSILDGWWPEGYSGDNGWTIGEARSYPSVEAQDAADADSLYLRLERDVIPLYYERDAAGLPRRWLRMMKNAIRTVTPAFHSDRQVQDYVNHLYAPG